jgi:hypothetical protein
MLPPAPRLGVSHDRPAQELCEEPQEIFPEGEEATEQQGHLRSSPSLICRAIRSAATGMTEATSQEAQHHNSSCWYTSP